MRLPPIAAMFGLVALLLASVVAEAAPGDAADVYVVTVAVDATAPSATAARDRARADGQRRAFRALLDRVTLKEDQAKLPRFDDNAVANIVLAFEVANERASAVRYLADYTFRFRPDEVRRRLRQAGVAVADTPSKPVAVVPLVRAGRGAPEEAPWRAAWAKLPPQGLVPAVLPPPDRIAALDPSRLEPPALLALAQGVGAGDAVLAIVDPRTDGGIDLAVQRVGIAALPAQSVSLPPIAGESEAERYGRAVAATVRLLEDQWKQRTAARDGEAGTLVVAAPVDSIEAWADLRERLSGLPSVRRVDVLWLGLGEARLELRHAGDVAQLQLALAQRDLALEAAKAGAPVSWTLRRRP